MGESKSLPFNSVIDIVKIINFYEEDDDHVFYRRFNRLHLYNLYNKHMRLIGLDKRISDVEAAVKNPTSSTTRPEAHERASKLGDLFVEIDEALKDFGSASLLYEQSMRLPSPAPYSLNRLKGQVKLDLRNFYKIYDEEMGWSECALYKASEKGFIHRLVDRYDFLYKWFGKKPNEQPTTMFIYKEAAVRRMEDIVVNTTCCVLVVFPIFALSYLTGKVEKLIVILTFVLLVSVVSSVLANAVHKSSLAVIATYAAILVVFLSNNPRT